MAPARKRSRAWDSCEDVEELKKMLEAKENELERYRSPTTASTPIVLSPEELSTAAEKLTTSIQKQIGNQIVYKPSMKTSRGTVRADVPGVTTEVFKLMLGNVLFAKATKGAAKRNIRLKAKEEDVKTIFGEPREFSKTLRYGAVVQLSGDLTLLLNQDTLDLEVKGFCKMIK